jgi:hypothetical protein
MTTPTLPEAARMALEALEWTYGGEPLPTMEKAAIDALRAALAASEAQVEPVATVRIHRAGGNAGLSWSAVPAENAPLMRDGEKLYTHPPAPQQPAPRVPLTHERDRPDQGSSYIEGYGYVATAALRAVERAHGIAAAPQHEGGA